MVVGRGPRRSPGLLSIVRVLRSTLHGHSLSSLHLNASALSFSLYLSICLPTILSALLARPLLLNYPLTRERHFQRFTCFSSRFFFSLSFFFNSRTSRLQNGNCQRRFPLYTRLSSSRLTFTVSISRIHSY